MLPYIEPSIDQYLRKRLMPVEGAIPHLPGIEMYGNSIPAGSVGGDLFEYINFQQRYDIDARIRGALNRAKEFLDTFHALMLSELDNHGKTTPELFEQINLRLAKSITARNVLGRGEQDDAREIATMLYGEVHPSGHFRFINFGHPPPLVFSASCRKFTQIDTRRMVQFPPLGLEIPEDHPDRNLYFSTVFRQTRANSSDVADIKLIGPGDILFLYTDGVYDGSDDDERQVLEALMRTYCELPAKDICNALLEYAQRKDDHLRQVGEQDRIDDKTVFIIKRNGMT